MIIAAITFRRLRSFIFPSFHQNLQNPSIQSLWASICFFLSVRLFQSQWRDLIWFFGEPLVANGGKKVLWAPGVKGHLGRHPPHHHHHHHNLRPPCHPATRRSPHCACSSTPPERSWARWPGLAPRWRAPGSGWAGPAAAGLTASSRGSSAGAPGWRTRPPAGWARNTSSSGPPGRCSWSALHTACRWQRRKEEQREAVEGWSNTVFLLLWNSILTQILCQDKLSFF